ncbi:peptidyl-prolyl cis-trans isomerase D [Mycoplana sp. BE70]|uniref:SurA N-terminal domain-containing protein n=1 Tax=Mycoplana sp. BE70 TaxID=2817775 RepID=UPI00285DE2E4|nr:SurA N-terminal domain-containing protein [Mycoplana sp. BE70]MDR6758209.1 peptidyl-prolyl cis-trans isomerase D [Mycoplana sp. BE70]
MLESLRKGAQTWVAKALLLILVASFGVWGISSSLVTGTSSAVVTVGDVKVSPTDFRLAYERQIASLSQRFGTRLTSEQARAFGVENQVFAELIAGAALDQLSRDMSLGLSKDRLAQLIADDPAFKGPNGKFDRVAFSSILRNAGLRENDYISNRSQVAVRSQVVEAVSDGYKAPATLTDAIKQYSNETRSLDYVLLSNANIEPVKAPAEDVISAWFEENKDKYRAPEYRKIVYVALAPQDIADPSTIDDAAVREDYEKNKEKYRTAETRTVEQLTFADRKSADEAAAKLASGTTYDALVAEQGKMATDVLLGDFSKATMPDQTLAEAAFAIAADGGTSPVVDGMFGPVILRATNIRPENTKSFDEVKDELRNELALAQASQDLMAVHDRFEEAQANGAKLEEAASQTKLKAVTIEAIDSTGKGKDGEDITLPEESALLAEAFKTDVGLESPPVNYGRDGYIWYEVLDILPARDRTLDEAREKVVADWTAQQQREALAKKAAEIAERVRKGEKLADIATDMGIAVEMKAGLRRGAEDPVLSPAAVAAAFAGPHGHVANAPGTGDEGQIVLQVTDVNSEAAGDALAGADQQIEAVARASGDDILDQMVSSLQSAYGVSINRALAERSMQ